MLARNTIASDCYIRTQQHVPFQDPSHFFHIPLPMSLWYCHLFTAMDTAGLREVPVLSVTSHGKLLSFFIAVMMSACDWWRAPWSASQTAPLLKWLKDRQGRCNDWLGMDNRGIGARELTGTEGFLFVGHVRPLVRHPSLTEPVTQQNPCTSLTFHYYSWITGPEWLGGILHVRTA